MGMSEEVEAEMREVYDCYAKDKEGNDKGASSLSCRFLFVWQRTNQSTVVSREMTPRPLLLRAER